MSTYFMKAKNQEIAKKNAFYRIYSERKALRFKKKTFKYYSAIKRNVKVP